MAPPDAGAFSVNLREVFASVGARGKESRKLDAGEGACAFVRDGDVIHFRFNV